MRYAVNYPATSQEVTREAIREEGVWRRHLLVLMPVITLYVALAFYQIDNQSLWTDEVISLNFAVSTEPISSIWFKSQCPLYYVLLRVWTKAAGTTEFALRSLSAILGISAVSLIYASGLRLFNRQTAAVAALLLATSPFFLWYSQEVRYINLMVVTSLLATYSFDRAISDGRFAWWVCYSVASILAAFSFVSVIFLFIAHGIYLFWSRSGWAVLSKWTVCQFVTFILFTAWFSTVYGAALGPGLTKTTTSISVRHTLTSETQRVFDLAGTIPYTFFAFSTGFSLGPSVPELHVSRSISSLAEHAIAIISVGLFFGLLFVLGLGRARQDKDAGIFLISWLLLPILGVFLAAAFTTFAAYNVRYVATALPAYFILLAAGIFSTQRPHFRLALLLVVLAFNGISLFNYYFDDRYARADTRSAALYLESAVRPDDIILIVGNTGSLEYYYKGDSTLVPFQREMNNNNSLYENLSKISKGHDRLWLVEHRPWDADPKGKVKAALEFLARPGEYKEFPGVEIYTYRLPGRRS